MILVNKLTLFFVACCCGGNLLVWSSSGNVDVHPFVNLLIAVLLFWACTGDEPFVTRRFSGVVRKFSTVLLASNLDACLCTCHSLFSDTVISDDNATALRVGTAFAIGGGIGAFMVASCTAGLPLVGVCARISSLRGICCCIAGVMTLAAQVMTWSIRDPCSLSFGLFSPAVPFIVAVVTITAHLFDVRTVQDMALVFYVNFLLVAVPLFDDSTELVSARTSVMWKTSTWLIFAASVVYVFAILTSSLQDCQGNADSSRSPPRQLQVLFATLGIVAAVVAFSVETPPQLERDVTMFQVSTALCVPLLCIWNALSASVSVRLVSLILSFVSGGQLIHAISPTDGHLLFTCALVVLSTSVVVTPTLQFCSKSSTDLKTQILRGLMCALLAAWAFTSNQTLKEPYKWPFQIFPSLVQMSALQLFGMNDVDAQRVVYFFCMIFSLNGALWPIGGSLASSTSGLLVACGLGFVAVYSLETPGAHFSIHPSPSPNEQSTPLVPNSARQVNG